MRTDGPTHGGAQLEPVSAADALAARHARLAALDLVTRPVWIFDIDRSRVYWANAAALAVWRAASLDELVSRDMAADMSESVARRLAQYQCDFDASGAVFNEQWTIYPAGEPVSLTVRFSGHRLPDGRMAMLCQGRHVVGDSPESLRSVEALLHTAVMITLHGLDGAVLYRNPAARASVRRLDESLAERLVDRSAHARLMASLGAHGLATLTLAVHTAQGERWHEISVRRCRDAVTGADAVLVSEVDVSALKRTEARASFLALHDSLTGLPNRSHVMQHFGTAMDALRAEDHEAALIFIDLDRFKDINDTLGHSAGDALLVHVARRLRAAVRATDLVARLGGDEFLIVISARDVRHEVDRLYPRIGQALDEPLRLEQTEVRITPSIGVAVYPSDGQDLETLLRHADLAMYTAKERGRNDLAYYHDGMGVALRTRTALEADLRLAFERGEFEVHYQPRVCSRSGRIVGAEALVRWPHPERGWVAPQVFLPLCEGNGLIRPLGLMVLERAARQQAAWAEAGHELRISVNLSPRQFGDAGLVESVHRVLKASNCDPSRIEFEVTESALMGPDDAPIAALRAFEAMGLAIALDDFGTGHANMADLQRFPIHAIKIDTRFVQGIDTNPSLADLVVAMSRLLRLTVVAEGVETRAQLDWVRERDIEHYQGHHFAPALRREDFEALLVT